MYTVGCCYFTMQIKPWVINNALVLTNNITTFKGLGSTLDIRMKSLHGHLCVLFKLLKQPVLLCSFLDTSASPSCKQIHQLGYKALDITQLLLNIICVYRDICVHTKDSEEQFLLSLLPDVRSSICHVYPTLMSSYLQMFYAQSS